MIPIYTERYMRLPSDNPEGYQAGSPTTHADKLRGKFLLVHGLLDNNVHFQNAARPPPPFTTPSATFRRCSTPASATESRAATSTST